MGDKTVFISGITSFTGAYIGSAFKKAGYKVTASLTTQRERYQADPILKKRLNFADPDTVVENCTFGSAAMIEAVKKLKPGIFVNHGAAIKGYRDLGFDYVGSVQHSLFNAQELFEALSAHSCLRFIHSGTVFEADEGNTNAGMTPSSEAVSIYGASKGMVWSALRYWANAANVPLSKVVIPNPIGPMENPDRLVPLFVKMWLARAIPTLKTPFLVRDNLPATWLANIYVDEANLAYESGWGSSLATPRLRRPSGFVISNEALIQELARRLKAAGLDRPCQVRLEPTETREPLERFNTERVRDLAQKEEVEHFWNEWCNALLAGAK